MNEELICLCGSKCPEEIVKLRQQLEQAETRVAELNEQKHKLKWRLAFQAVHHLRLHNKWVCGELKLPEEESIVNPFIFAETEVWWAIGDEADGFAKEIEAQEEYATNLQPEPNHSDAWLLRKQAEAVESWVNGFGNRDRAGLTEYAGGFCDGFKSATQSISAYAQHLHKKADEAEKENTHA